MSDERPLVSGDSIDYRPGHPEAFWLHLPTLKRILSRAGLALVPAADVPTPEERAVLEAIERAYKRLGDDPAYYHVTHETIGEMLGGRYDYGFASAANAMLARRSAKAGAK